MTGDKPDEQLRTPMQWMGAAGAGFTRGTPWEPLQRDWPATNVVAQEGDSVSLLSTYRRFIHLRADNPALGGGDYVRLEATSPAVAAYLRRAGGRVVLVVANLGASRVSAIELASSAAVLRAGEYATTPLVRGVPAAKFSVAADGRIRGYVPFATLGPLEARVVEVSSIP